MELEWMVVEPLPPRAGHLITRSLGIFRSFDEAVQVKVSLQTPAPLRWRQRTDFDGVRRAFAWREDVPTENPELLDAWLSA